MRTETPFGPWDPLAPSEVAALMRGVGVPWWIAGGHAIEAFVGRAFRTHEDIDVGIFRDDHRCVRVWLAGWDAHCADPPGALRPWPANESLPPGVHDVWLRERRDTPWRFQLLLNEREGDEWVSRRDSRTRAAIADLVIERGGLPCLAPEIQLLLKAKNARPKDDSDFEVALPQLSPARIRWLREHLAAEMPDHPWRVRL